MGSADLQKLGGSQGVEFATVKALHRLEDKPWGEAGRQLQLRFIQASDPANPSGAVSF